jgi:hypothetical protein
VCIWKFNSLAQWTLICSGLTSLPLNAQSRKTQAQHLVDLTAKKHPEISGLELSATRDGWERCVTIAATNAKDLGKKWDKDDEAIAVRKLEPFVEHEPDGFDVTAPLHDAKGKLMGTLGIDFKPHAGETRAGIVKRTAAILKEMEQQIPSNRRRIFLNLLRVLRWGMCLLPKGQRDAERAAVGSRMLENESAMVQFSNRACDG